METWSACHHRLKKTRKEQGVHGGERELAAGGKDGSRGDSAPESRCSNLRFPRQISSGGVRLTASQVCISLFPEIYGGPENLHEVKQDF